MSPVWSSCLQFEQHFTLEGLHWFSQLINVQFRQNHNEEHEQDSLTRLTRSQGCASRCFVRCAELSLRLLSFSSAVPPKVPASLSHLAAMQRCGTCPLSRAAASGGGSCNYCTSVLAGQHGSLIKRKWNGPISIFEGVMYQEYYISIHSHAHFICDS